MGILGRIIVLLAAAAIAGCAASSKRVRADSVTQVKLSAKPAKDAAACVAANARRLGMSSRVERGPAPLDYTVVASYQPGNVVHAAAVTDVKTYIDEGTSLRTYVGSFASSGLGAGLQEGC